MSTLAVNTLQAQTGSNVTVASGTTLQAPGHVVQMQSTTTRLFASTTSTTLADLLTISFTPKFSTSQLLIDVCLRFQENATNTNLIYKVLNGSTTVYQVNNYSVYHDAAGNSIDTLTFHAVGAAGSTSARDIKFQAAKYQTGGTFTVNVNDPVGTGTRMTVMEIAQ